MTARTLATLCVVGLVLLAGCGGLSGDAAETPVSNETDGQNATPTGTPTESAGSVEEFAYPAGANADGFGNVSDLADAHGEALRGQDVESRYQRISWEQDASGNQSSLRSVFTADIRSDFESERLLLTTNGSYVGQDRVQTVSLTTSLATANETYTRSVDRTGNATYSVDTPSSDFAARHASISTTGIRPILEGANWNATEVTQRNGTKLVRYEPTGLTTDDQATNENAANLTGQVLVDEDGVVHGAELGFVVAGNVSQPSQVVRYDYDLNASSDVTVEDPDWLDEARSGGA
ncbi:DUF7537 family lipoprotein [Halomicrobium salinisoli]|uniref:DUF7537 family lipoprotein n=1 Tax=Halomicrobium salinisoli TaxID=2878391 RepID=UPI001CF038F0|nr:hypothetical protein [Halomicrobium salinisoli]